MYSMAHDSEPLGQAADAESAHLMHDSQDEKDQSPSDLLYTGSRRQLVNLRKPAIFALVLATALISTLISGLVLHFLKIPTFGDPITSPGTEFGSCGDSPSSARQDNCIFDLMSFSWLPPPCADPDLTAQFVGLQNWTWWVDENRTTAVPLEEVSKGNHAELFVTREYHMYHCTYMWRKLHRGLLKSDETPERRGVVDTYIGRYEHTSHCEMMLLGMEGEHGMVGRNATDTAILMKFPRCMWT
jgi:hypothetical protein